MYAIRSYYERTWFANNTAGVVREWWCHTATSYWFIAERHTVTDEILRTYPAGELFAARIDFAPREAGDKGDKSK